jgi:toxic protein SymE
MADANLNARPAHPERYVTIQQSWRYRQWKPNRYYRTGPPLFP